MQSSGDTDSQNSWPPYQIEGLQGLGKYVYFIFLFISDLFTKKEKGFRRGSWLELLLGRTVFCSNT